MTNGMLIGLYHGVRPVARLGNWRQLKLDNACFPALLYNFW